MYTKRAVLYIGYGCNSNCIHCYYKFKSKGFEALDSCKAVALKCREQFGDQYVDITGGEPSVYPDIVPLISYCAAIGLKPTIITNTLVMGQRAKEFREAGLYDVLASIHTTPELADTIYGVSNAWARIDAGVNEINRNFPVWRTNVTIMEQNYKHLSEITQYAIDHGSRAINFISFNPYHEWKTQKYIECQARYPLVEPYLNEALQLCKDNGVRPSVRYYPFCMIKGHEETISGWKQLSFDPYEWNFESWLGQWYKWEPGLSRDAMADQIVQKEMVKPNICAGCNLRRICDGLSKQYFERFGEIDLIPYTSGDILLAYDYYRGELNNITGGVLS